MVCLSSEVVGAGKAVVVAVESVFEVDMFVNESFTDQSSTSWFPS